MCKYWDEGSVAARSSIVPASIEFCVWLSKHVSSLGTIKHTCVYHSMESVHTLKTWTCLTDHTQNARTQVDTSFLGLKHPVSCVSVFTDTHQLFALGSLHKVDPNRVVCKRIVLSGHPFKINKKSAVIRYMFFNRGIYIQY